MDAYINKRVNELEKACSDLKAFFTEYVDKKVEYLEKKTELQQKISANDIKGDILKSVKEHIAENNKEQEKQSNETFKETIDKIKEIIKKEVCIEKTVIHSIARDTLEKMLADKIQNFKSQMVSVMDTLMEHTPANAEYEEVQVGLEYMFSDKIQLLKSQMIAVMDSLTEPTTEDLEAKDVASFLNEQKTQNAESAKAKNIQMKELMKRILRDETIDELKERLEESDSVSCKIVDTKILLEMDHLLEKNIKTIGDLEDKNADLSRRIAYLETVLTENGYVFDYEEDDAESEAESEKKRKADAVSQESKQYAEHEPESAQDDLKPAAKKNKTE